MIKLDEKNKKWRLGLLMMALIMFFMLSILTSIYPLLWVDRWFSKGVQGYQSLWLDKLMLFVSWFGYTDGAIITVIIVACVCYFFSYKREAVFILLTLCSSIFSTVFKFLVGRPRPSAQIVRILSETNQESFPSGHVTFYMVLFGFILSLTHRLNSVNKTLRIFIGSTAVFLIVTIPFSRIYLGAHWLTDVLGGLLLGYLCLQALLYFYLKKGKPLNF